MNELSNEDLRQLLRDLNAEMYSRGMSTAKELNLIIKSRVKKDSRTGRFVVCENE